ncbi:MAG: cell division protein FtsH, partial [Rhodospirillales bacterium]|nr:cell division protein FtsH [Rhodospirillales bacterium]
RIVEEAYQRARQILTDNDHELETLGKALLEYETLSGEEIKALLRGEAILREDPPQDSDSSRPRSSVPRGGGNPSGSSDGMPQGV